jgi:hypothetical protein
LGAVNALTDEVLTDDSGAAYKDNAALFATAASTTVSAGKTSSTGAAVDAVAEAIVKIADAITGLNAAAVAFAAINVPAAVPATPTLAEVQAKVDSIAAQLRAAATDAAVKAFLTATTFVASASAAEPPVWTVKLTYNEIFLNQSSAVTGVASWSAYTIVAGNVAGAGTFANVKFYLGAADDLANGFTDETTYAQATAVLGAAVTSISIADAGKFLYAVEFTAAGSGTVKLKGAQLIDAAPAPTAATTLVTIAGFGPSSADLETGVSGPTLPDGTIQFVDPVVNGLVSIIDGGDYTDIVWFVNGVDVTSYAGVGGTTYQLPVYEAQTYYVEVQAKDASGAVQSGGVKVEITL